MYSPTTTPHLDSFRFRRDSHNHASVDSRNARFTTGPTPSPSSSNLHDQDPLASSSANNQLRKTATANSNTGDNYSITSSYSEASYNSRADNSLIFERLVQDPLIEGQPMPSSLPRHHTSETFIPASLDTTTHMIRNNTIDIHDLNEPTEFGFNSRKSSLANLEAALGGSSSNLSSRRPSSANLPTLNSFRSANLSRVSTTSSFSNLTDAFQKSQYPNSNTTTTTTTTPTAAANNTNNNNNNNHNNNANSSTCNLNQNSNINLLPPLSKSVTSTSVSSYASQRAQNAPVSPLQKNKSFYSYADIIAQDDQDSKFAIRRPSISTSLSNQKMARTGSFGSCNSPRSPSVCGSLCNPTNVNSPNSLRTNSFSANQRLRNTSPTFKVDSHSDNNNNTSNNNNDDDSIFSMSGLNNTPKRSIGFSGTPISSSTMRGSISQNSVLTTSNIDHLLKSTTSNESAASDKS